MKSDTVIGSIVLFCALSLISGYSYGLWWLHDYRVQEQRWEEISRVMDEQRYKIFMAEHVTIALDSVRVSIGKNGYTSIQAIHDTIIYDAAADTLGLLAHPKFSEVDTTIVEYDRIDDQWYKILLHYSAYLDGWTGSDRFLIPAWEVPGWAIIEEVRGIDETTGH